MKQLQYVVRYLLKARGNNLIKIISLTLGLFVGLILFAQVAFEMSYDNFYPDKEQLYLLYVKGKTPGNETYDVHVVNSPFAPTMYKDIPEVISAANIFYNITDMRFKVDGNAFEERTVFADSLFFHTLGFPVLEGDPKELRVENVMFISESFAKRAFGDISKAINQSCKYEDMSYTVRGVFADLPENGHLQFDVAISMTRFTKEYSEDDARAWMGNDAYCCYVRLAPGVDPNRLPDKIMEMRKRHYDVEAQHKAGYFSEHYLVPITRIHSGDKIVLRTCLILSLLAFSLLFASAMNYVLISISSLAVRAKSVGVHKCNGASNGNVFSMFMFETLVLILVSLVLTVLLIFIFRDQVETLVKTNLEAIFALDNLWTVGVVLLVLVLLTGVIPARIFSSLPVTLVFRSYRDNKRRWKQVLLWLQFTGITFLLMLLVVIVYQYHMMLTKEIGYTPDRVVFTQWMNTQNEEQMRMMKEEFLKYPGVESVSIASALPSQQLSGQHVDDPETKESIFGSRYLSTDKDYLTTMGMELVAGRAFTDGSLERREIIVNETFARTLNKPNPIGEQVFYFYEMCTICGVVKDFQYWSFLNEIPPVVLLPEFHWACPSKMLTLRLGKEITPDVLLDLNQRLAGLTHRDDYTMQPFAITNEWNYKDIRLFRNSVIVAAFIMLVITLLGLLGYIADEVHRRSKEIAIRKVNGARALDILRILSKDISYIGVPSILIGLGVAYIVGVEWLKQFVVKIPLSIALCLGCGLIIWLVIQLCLVLRAWNVANENPVKSIKSE